MINEDDIEKEVQELQEEIASWNLSTKDYQSFEGLMQFMFEVKSAFVKAVVSNRYFCSTCAMRMIGERSIEGTPILEYLSTVQKTDNSDINFSFVLTEFLFLSYLCAMMNHTGPKFLIDHLDLIIKAKYPQLKKKEDMEPILNLRITSLALNSMFNELLHKLLDFISAYVYSMSLDADTRRKVTTFILLRAFVYVHKYTIGFYESDNTYNVMLHKFKASVFEGCDIQDPLIFRKTMEKK